MKAMPTLSPNNSISKMYPSAMFERVDRFMQNDAYSSSVANDTVKTASGFSLLSFAASI